MCFVTAAAAGSTMAAAGTNAAIVASMAMSAYGAHQQSRAAQQQAEYQAKVQENNARVAEWQAQDAERRGHREAEDARRQGAAMRGQQRATMAARGLDLSTGSAAQIVDDTDFFSMVDQQTARRGGAMEAWEARAQGTSMQAEAGLHRARARSENPMLAAGTSLLGSAAGAQQRWVRHR